MTGDKIKRSVCKNGWRSGLSAIMTTLVLTLTLALTFFLSEEISIAVKNALLLCAGVIIPSVFPFMILSDFLYCFIDFGSMKKLGDLFEKLFKINRIGLYPFTLGILCGFPLGVKCASSLYADGLISREECERIIGFCNNTGPAFLVCGIGIGLWNNIYDGFALYFATVFSAVAVGVLFSVGKAPTSAECSKYTSDTFSITRSVRNAGIGCLNICSYLTFFACAVGIIRSFLGEGLIYLFTVPFFEVGTATDILSRTVLLSAPIRLALSAFAVGFSGFSVHLQAMSFISETDIRVGKYFIMKLAQGLLASAMVLLSYPMYH